MSALINASAHLIPVLTVLLIINAEIIKSWRLTQFQGPITLFIIFQSDDDMICVIKYQLLHIIPYIRHFGGGHGTTNQFTLILKYVNIKYNLLDVPR